MRKRHHEALPNSSFPPNVINSTLTNCYGRFANQFIRNICVSAIAKKYDLSFRYKHYDEITNIMGIELYVNGKNTFDKTIEFKDEYFEEYLFDETTETNDDEKHNICVDKIFLQTESTARYIKEQLYLNKDNIIDANPFKEKYQNNNDIFIHIRLGDIITTYNYVPQGFEKYLRNTLNKAITKENNIWKDKMQNKKVKNLHLTKKMMYNLMNTKQKYQETESPKWNVYIASDTLQHPICQNLIKDFQNICNVKTVNDTPIQTIQFASTCKHIILSNGTFSWLIGVLGFYSDVYFPTIKIKWHGDIFVFPDWNEEFF